MYYLYILRSVPKGIIYVGTTKDVRQRLESHNSGRNRSTKAYRPWTLVYIEEFPNLSEARKREWRLKCTPAGGREKQRLAAGG